MKPKPSQRPQRSPRCQAQKHRLTTSTMVLAWYTVSTAKLERSGTSTNTTAHSTPNSAQPIISRSMRPEKRLTEPTSRTSSVPAVHDSWLNT
jgi:hypothetical protein